VPENDNCHCAATIQKLR